MYNNILVIFFSDLYSIVKDSNFHFQGHQTNQSLKCFGNMKQCFSCVFMSQEYFIIKFY